MGGPRGDNVVADVAAAAAAAVVALFVALDELLEDDDLGGPRGGAMPLLDCISFFMG